MAETIELKKINDSDAPKEVKEVYRLLKRYKDDPDREWWRKEVYEKPWKAVWENELWEADDLQAMKDKGQIPLAVNDMHKGVQASTATITASKPGIMAMPIGSSDLYVAELIKRGVDFVIERQGGMGKLIRFAKWVKTGSCAFLDIYYDKSKGLWGKIIIRPRKPVSQDGSGGVFWDKYAEEEDLSDSPIIKARLVSREYIKDNYPDLKEDDIKFDGGVDREETPGQSSGVEGADNYAIESSKGDTGPGEEEDSKKNIWEIEAWIPRKIKQWWLVAVNPADQGLQLLGTYDKKNDAEEAMALAMGNNPIPMKVWERLVEVREQRIIVGKAIVETEQNPHGTDADGEPIMSIIPLMHDETLRGMPVGPSYFALEVSRERNKRRMQAILVVSRNLDAPIQITEDYKIVEDKKLGTIIQIPKTSAIPASRLLPGTTTAEIMQLQEVARNDVKDIYDAQDVAVGKMPSSEMSGRSILALQDTAGMMTRPFTSKLEDAISKMAKVIIAIQLKHWPAEAWKRLIEPEEWDNFVPEKLQAQLEMQPGDKPNPMAVQGAWQQAIQIITTKGMSVVDLDVKVAAGSTMPTSRYAKRAEAMEMMKVGMADVQYALEYVDDPKAKEVAERIEKKQEMMALAGVKK